MDAIAGKSMLSVLTFFAFASFSAAALLATAVWLSPLRKRYLLSVRPSLLWLALLRICGSSVWFHFLVCCVGSWIRSSRGACAVLAIVRRNAGLVRRVM